MGDEQRRNPKIAEIAVPDELNGKTLFDSAGNRYDVRWKNNWIGFPQPRLVLRDTGVAVKFSSLLGTGLAKELDGPFSELTEGRLKSMTARIALFFRNCLKAGEKRFRKELLAKLGETGKGFFRDFVSEKFDVIGQEWARLNTGVAMLTTDGPLPSGLRFRWEYKVKSTNYSIYCLEQAPQLRNVKLQGKYRRLAFPWVYFFVPFKDGGLMLRGGLGSVSVFYSPTRLNGPNETLYFTNLIHVMPEWPYATCPRGMPPIKLSQPDWEERLLEWFWESEFWEENNRALAFYRWVIEQVPELDSYDKWEEISRTNPEQMLKINFPALDHDLGAYIKRRFAESAQGGEGDPEAIKKKRVAALKNLIDQFGEQLEERIVFLGAHFTVPDDLQQQALDAGKKAFGELKGGLAADLSALGHRAAADSFRQYDNYLNGEGDLKGNPPTREASKGKGEKK